MSYDKYAENSDRNDDRKCYGNKILYSHASKKTQGFLKATKKMRLSIEKRLETLDDNDSSSHMIASTRCLEDRIKQCDVTLNNLLQLKDRFLNKQMLSAPTLAPMKFELLFSTDGFGAEIGYNRNFSNLFPLSQQLTSDSFASNLYEYSCMRSTLRQTSTNNFFTELTQYDLLNSIQLRDSSLSTSRSYDCPMDSHTNDVIPHVTGFTRYSENAAQPCIQCKNMQQDNEEPRVTGFVKFNSNIGDMQKILEQNCRKRDGQMAGIEAFVKGQPSEVQHFAAGGNPPELDHQNVVYDWGHPRQAAKPMHMNPIYCGPSKLRPIFDKKIQKLEQQIVKYCFEIKEKNILIEQSCHAKEVLMCQKHNLHNILLNLCEKIKQLEKKLYQIKMAVCCPNFPIQDCSTNSSCREEIQSLKKLEDKLETLFNGAKHKECLLEICKQSVRVLQQDKAEWQDSIKDMERIQGELQKQLEDIRLKACRRKPSPPSPRLFAAEEPTIGIGEDIGMGTGTDNGTGRSGTGRSENRSPRKPRPLEDSDSSGLDDYIFKDYERRSRRNTRQRPATSTHMPVTGHSCHPDCRCKKQ